MRNSSFYVVGNDLARSLGFAARNNIRWCLPFPVRNLSQLRSTSLCLAS